VVVLAAAEESSMCVETNGCLFSFVTPAHTISNLNPVFDQARALGPIPKDLDSEMDQQVSVSAKK